MKTNLLFLSLAYLLSGITVNDKQGTNSLELAVPKEIISIDKQADELDNLELSNYCSHEYNALNSDELYSVDDIVYSKEYLADGMSVKRMEFPVQKVVDGLIGDICKKIFKSSTLEWLCIGGLSYGSYLLNCATYESTYQGDFYFFGTYYWKMHNCGKHVHVAITGKDRSDLNFEGYQGCN